MKINLKQDNVAPNPPTHNIIMSELDFNVEFPLLCLLQFSSEKVNSMLKFNLKQDNVAPKPTQHYLVWFRLLSKISSVMPLTISKWLKKYYSKALT